MNKLLLHCCCAHCAAYTIDYFRQQGFDVTCLWYNPNIHPFTEHQRRLESIEVLAGEKSAPLIIAGEYDMTDYFRQVTGHEEERCRYCFDLRLLVTAEYARENGFDAFTTTLLISPQQDHELIRETGERLAEEYGIEFLYADLRKRYSDSRHITKPMELYRQQYCGCVYSEWERYRDSNPKKA